MIKLVYLSPTLHDGIPKNPGDTKFFDETSLDSLKELKAILNVSNPLSGKVAIVPEHQQVYQLALTQFNLEDIYLSTQSSSNEWLDPLHIEDNVFIKETQVAVKRVSNEVKEVRQQIEEQYITTESVIVPTLVDEVSQASDITEVEQQIIEVVEEVSSNYSLENEIRARKEELDNAHPKKIKTLAEQYSITYSNKETTIKAILYKEFEETAKSLGQEDLLNN